MKIYQKFSEKIIKYYEDIGIIMDESDLSWIWFAVVFAIVELIVIKFI